MEKWPVLSYENGKATYSALHMWTQIVGKIKLATLPWINHSWHITLHITPVGLTTQMLPYHDKNFQIDFDFIEHRLKIVTSKGERSSFDLHNFSVADFYHKIFAALADLDIQITIRPVPVEILNPIPFEEDTTQRGYDKDQALAFHQAMLKIHDSFLQFRGSFIGKCSPIHFFWGSFDLALSLFSGRNAPKHPGGIPGLPNWVAAEAYSREVTSSGFWPGSEAYPEAAFYCYLYPEPEAYANAKINPAAAYYEQSLREFILPYSAVQQADDPTAELLEFLHSTYHAGADLAKWDQGLMDD